VVWKGILEWYDMIYCRNTATLHQSTFSSLHLRGCTLTYVRYLRYLICTIKCVPHCVIYRYLPPRILCHVFASFFHVHLPTSPSTLRLLSVLHHPFRYMKSWSNSIGNDPNTCLYSSSHIRSSVLVWSSPCPPNIASFLRHCVLLSAIHLDERVHLLSAIISRVCSILCILYNPDSALTFVSGYSSWGFSLPSSGSSFLRSYRSLRSLHENYFTPFLLSFVILPVRCCPQVFMLSCVRVLINFSTLSPNLTVWYTFATSHVFSTTFGYIVDTYNSYAEHSPNPFLFRISPSYRFPITTRFLPSSFSTSWRKSGGWYYHDVFPCHNASLPVPSLPTSWSSVLRKGWITHMPSYQLP
jgi:hypothetical protein